MNRHELHELGWTPNRELHELGWTPVGDFDNLQKIAYAGMMLTYSLQTMCSIYRFTAIIKSIEQSETSKAIPIYIPDSMEHDAISMTESLNGWFYMPKQITNDPIGKE